MNQPANPGFIILSSDDELGPNDRTPPRVTEPNDTQPPTDPNQASSSRYFYHNRVNTDGPLGDANPILNPITVNRPGPSRYVSLILRL